jgi:integrase
MRWPEIDLDKKIWTVPAGRMKAGREHRVPLSPRAVATLHRLKELKAGEFVFPGQSRNKPLEYGHGDGFAPDEGRGCHGSRLPLQLPGLGRQRLQLSHVN